MYKDRPSFTSLLVALFGVVIQGGDRYGQSLLPANIVPAQISILKAAGFVPASIPTSVLSNPIVAKSVRAVANLFMKDVFDGLSYRKSWIEARVRSALDSGDYKTVLVVAAGYDTMAYRLSLEYPTVKFFELDHPATYAFKRRAIQNLQAEDRFHMISGDLVEDSLESILRKNQSHLGGQFPMNSDNTIVVVEGLTFYLTEAQNLQLLRDIANCTGNGSVVLLNHFTAQSIQRQGILVRLTAYFKEPMKFGMRLEDVASFAQRSLWTLIEQGQKGHECLAMFQKQPTLSKYHEPCYRYLPRKKRFAPRNAAICAWKD